jgi:hypothetical protein
MLLVALSLLTKDTLKIRTHNHWIEITRIVAFYGTYLKKCSSIPGRGRS